MLKMYRKYEISVYDYQAANPLASLSFVGPASRRPVLVLLTYFSLRFNGNNDNDVHCDDEDDDNDI